MNQRTNRSSGFTLIELAVVLAIIAVLAGVLTPLVTNYIEDARKVRATNDAQTIADAILSFNKDTGRWPVFTPPLPATFTTASGVFQVLAGPGAYPVCDSTVITCSTATWTTDTAAIDQISNALEYNKPGGAALGYTTSGKFAWRGPYVPNLAADPWGNAYVVNAGSLKMGLSPFQAGFVLSAGPNEKIETAFSQSIGSGSSAFLTGGDDILYRIR